MFLPHGKETENNDTKPSNNTENEENQSDELDSLNISTSFYGKMAYPIEIWAQSSLNAVLAIFCNLMWTAALLAGELEKTTDFGVEPLGNNEEDGPSLELEKWMNQFELIINFIEEINDCFGISWHSLCYILLVLHQENYFGSFLLSVIIKRLMIFLSMDMGRLFTLVSGR